MHTSICSPFSLNLPSSFPTFKNSIPSSFSSLFPIMFGAICRSIKSYMLPIHICRTMSLHIQHHSIVIWHDTHLVRRIECYIYIFYFVNLWNEMHVRDWDWIYQIVWTVNAISWKCICTSSRWRMKNALEMYYMLKILCTFMYNISDVFRVNLFAFKWLTW